MRELFLYDPFFYVCIFGFVLVMASRKVIRETLRRAVDSGADMGADALALARGFLRRASLEDRLTVHTGTGIVYHAGRDTLYLAQASAGLRDLCTGAAVLHEAARAASFHRRPGLWRLRNAVSFVLRLACIAGLPVFVLCLIFGWDAGVRFAMGAYGLATAFALATLPAERALSRAAEACCSEVCPDMSQQDRALLNGVFLAHDLLGVSNIFQPVESTARFLFPLRRGFSMLPPSAPEKGREKDEKKK